MKNYLILLFCGIVLMSCSKDDGKSIAAESSTAKLIGNWNWTASSGGIDGITHTPESTGNTILLEVSNNTVKKYVNGNLESERNYSTETGISIIFGEPKEMMIYESGINQTIVLTENNLVLYDECYDCFQNEYTKE